jgi:hypothetical protein
MHDLIRQLEGLADAARRMIVAQRLAQLFTAAVIALLAAGLIDFALRLPGGLRLVIGVSAAALGAWWLLTRLARARRFRPDVATIALRAERLYPQLKDVLASGVEFAATPEAFRDPKLTAAFADVAVRQAGDRAQGVSLRRLLDPTLTLRWSAVALVAAVAMSAAVLAAPGHAALAMQRWLMPLGEAQWPRRTAIESLVRDTVWPTDTPLRVEAAVTQGYHPGMRAWIHYRVRKPDGQFRSWQSTLMNDQGERARQGKGGRFERLIELPELHAAASRDAFDIELYMSAGDDQTAAQPILMVVRPAVRSVRATLEPPAYAQGLVTTQQVSLDEQTGPVATASALQGATVRLDVTFNKPLPASAATGFLPGLTTNQDTSADDSVIGQISRSFTLDATVQTPITLTDAHGLSSVSDRLYRIEAVEDRPPAVALVEPIADESVLATAMVGVEAAAQDDVGVEKLHLEAQMPLRDAGTTQATSTTANLAVQEGRSPRLRLTYSLDLAPFSLHAGDEVTLTAVAQDVFAFNGTRHDPVRSSPRKLRIIDVPTLVAQVRSELANIRQQAIRLEGTQRDLMEQPADAAVAGQQQLDRRLDAQQQALRTLAQRLERNRLEEPTLQQTMERAAHLLDQADRTSQQASQALQQSASEPSRPQAEQKLQEARQRQQETRDALGELITMLDQGRDALTLQLQLRQMLTQQEQLTDDTRRMLPRTAGQRPEDLQPEDQRDLGDLSDRQASLARQAEELARQMQATADALQRQGDSDHDQAAAQALREAAAIAQRQGLSPQMDKASQSTQENKLSDAGQQQLGAIDTMQQMMGAMGSQERKRQEMLRRRLAELNELIRKLVEQQKVQLARLEQVPPGQTLAGLDEGMSVLRRNTMSVEAEARKSPETAPVAEVIGKAVIEQAAAITALRTDQRTDAELGERQSLAYLEEALKLIDEARQQADEDMTNQQRNELEQAYRKLAQRQKELRERTVPLTGLDRMDRRQRADMTQLGHEQADLQIDAADLREKVEQTLVFLQAHRRIDEGAARVARQLRAGQSDAGVLFDQEMIEARLLAMAEALKQEQRDREFREDEQGGGGGGGGQPPELIPPIAELRLLRGTQEAIYHQTRSADTAIQTASDAAPLHRRLTDLSAQQRELSDLGKQLIEKVNSQTGAGE